MTLKGPWLAIAALPLAACAPGGGIDDVATTQQVFQPYIQWDISSPIDSRGESATGADTDLWSVAPEPGATFELTFKHAGFGFHFEAARTAYVVGAPAAIGEHTLFVPRAHGETCTTFTGSYVVGSELP